MFSTIKMYIAAGFAAVVAIFIAIYKARGTKIENLEAEIRIEKVTAEVNKRKVDNESKAAQFVADNRVAEVDVEVANEKGNTKYNPGDKFYI